MQNGVCTAHDMVPMHMHACRLRRAALTLLLLAGAAADWQVAAPACKPHILGALQLGDGGAAHCLWSGRLCQEEAWTGEQSGDH